MIRFHLSLTLACLLPLCVAGTAFGGLVITVNLAPPLKGGVADPSGLSFAVAVLDNTTPSHGVPKNALYEPDHVNGNGPDPLTTVDFNGEFTVGFDIPLTDRPGVDCVLFGVQLNVPEEDFTLYVGENGNYTALGTFSGTASGLAPGVYNLKQSYTIAVDFNGEPVPCGSNQLRFVGVSTGPPIFSIDVDAVGVVASDVGAADLDSDGSVDGADLGLLLGAWGVGGFGDLNGDCVVDGADLGLLLGAWTG